MGEAHEDLHITSEEFDEVGAEICRALDQCNVPDREKQEVLDAHRREKRRSDQPDARLIAACSNCPSPPPLRP